MTAIGTGSMVGYRECCKNEVSYFLVKKALNEMVEAYDIILTKFYEDNHPEL